MPRTLDQRLAKTQMAKRQYSRRESFRKVAQSYIFSLRQTGKTGETITAQKFPALGYRREGVVYINDGEQPSGTNRSQEDSGYVRPNHL